MDAQRSGERIRPSEWVLLALIFALPLMKPPVRGEVIAADLLFLVLVAVVAMEVVFGRRRLEWLSGFGALIAYVAALAPSLLASTDLGASLFKYATEFYLISLVGLTALIIDNESRFRRATLAWLAGTAVTCLVGLLGLGAFATGWAPGLLDYASFGFGSLPPGHYPRLSLTFFNANMACNYLTVSLGLLLIAGHRNYLPKAVWWGLLIGIAVAALSTISAGLGGVPLLGAIWVWLTRRQSRPLIAWAALLAGIAVAVLFLIALALTVVPYAAPFVIHLPSVTLYASGRVLTWTAAAQQFVRHPLLGVGLGIGPVDVHYPNPSGYLEGLTDAHNTVLSIAAQTGIIGLIGLVAIIGFVARRTGKSLRVTILGLTFLNVFLYQGLGGSFEDTRHIWVLLGLFIAACRLDLSRADGKNHRAGQPSPC